MKNQRIVVVGGGTGVYQVVQHLKHRCQNITSIHTMSDGGGHSGKLRDELGVLPPGDLVRGILAGAKDGIQWALRQLMTYRFNAPATSLDRATWGNITFAALCDVHKGNVINAVNDLCHLVQCQTKPLPVTVEDAHLCACMDDGSEICGEGLIDHRSPQDLRRIVSVYLKPSVKMFPGAVGEIVRADKVVFCPGSLYTSIIACTLADGFKEALQRSRAKMVAVVNTMTNHTETPGFKASCHIRELLRYTGLKMFDTVICNSGKIDHALVSKYAAEGSCPVKVDRKVLKRYARRVMVRNVIDQTGGIVRHGPKLASIIVGL